MDFTYTFLVRNITMHKGYCNLRFYHSESLAVKGLEFGVLPPLRFSLFY